MIKTNDKSYVMLLLAAVVTAFSLIVHVLHRHFDFLELYASMRGVTSLSPTLLLVLNMIMVLPIVLLSTLYWAVKRKHYSQQLLTTLTLTTASISIIAGGDGLTEYHFSIFMVVAMIASFQKIRYVMISAIIFTLHHVSGFFFFPQLLCGTTDYSFSLLMIHAIFLIMTAASTTIVILFTRRNEQVLAYEREQAEQKLHALFNEITMESVRLNELSGQLAVGAATTERSSSNITASLSNFQCSAEQEAHVLQTSIADTEETFTQLTAISERTAQLQKKASDSLVEASNGTAAIHTVHTQMQVITETIAGVKSLIEMLAAHSSEIAHTVTVVNTISEQTKLLALNASIEAARAGEHGKGFAVVATEISKLASHTQHSVRTIDDVLKNIRTQINDVAIKMTDGMNEIYRGHDILSASEQSFTAIHTLVSHLQLDVTHIAHATNELVAQTNQSMTRFTHIAETNYASLQSVHVITDAAKEQHSVVADLQQAIEQLNRVTTHFQHLTAQVNETPVNA